MKIGLKNFLDIFGVQLIHKNQHQKIKATIRNTIHAFRANAPDELSVGKDEEVQVLESPNGTGWTYVRSENGVDGLVLTSNLYDKNKTKKYAIAVFDYATQAPEFLFFNVGDKIAIIEKDDGSG